MNNCHFAFLATRGCITNIIPLAPENHLFQIKLERPSELADCQPGQFVQLWVPGVGECPISVCSGRVDGIIELCVRKVGRVTGALFSLNPGDIVGLRGPYGNGFPMDLYRGKNLVLIAGGLGVAPIRSLWQYILENRKEFKKLILVYGMRHSTDLLFRRELQVLFGRHDVEIFVGAEEIDKPEVQPISVQLGRVTDALRLADVQPDYHAAVCGPPVMYKYVVEELKAKGLSDSNIWLSLERHMKCGIGKCGHCFIGGTLACQEGPVFCLEKLHFMAEALECA